MHIYRPEDDSNLKKTPFCVSLLSDFSLFVFQALGCCYFIHESLKNIQQFDFKAKKFRKVVGKEVHSDSLPSTATLEKEKFPQDYFPEVRLLLHTS
ncbi:Inositol polyphosphate-5-phosphatase A [Labeo rohita]|uniref:Inositol polyphosphate-5-phosphatase A n=1 Tax=Labeo rohita TaxID=84645 RepID=A0ABQ8M5I5_LABRO|nr:Inositol polyphosphate-5-phosphatase A [Labeo rohita]